MNKLTLESKNELVVQQCYRLIEGNPTRILRIIHHLLFKVSKKFTNDFLHAKCGVDLEI